MELILTIKRFIFLCIVIILNFFRNLFTKILYFLCPSLMKRLALKCLNIEVNTGLPEDIRVVDEYNFWITMCASGRYGLAEAYCKGYFECDQLDLLYFNIVRDGNLKYLKYFHPYVICRNLLYKLFDRRISSTAWEMGGKHYDIGVDLYRMFLGETMNYSCGYWDKATDLDSSQIDKMHLIARKLHLRPGMKVLDIGCGYGSLAKFLAENYAVQVIGVTVSVEHATYASQNCKDFSVEIRLQDYRDITERFDRIIAVEMLEHIGVNNYKDFFKQVRRNLTEDGLFLLHVIGVNQTHIEPYDIFLNENIYLNMHFPSIEQIAKLTTDTLVVEDLHNLGNDFAKTMKCWFQYFQKSRLDVEHKYGKDFYRLWSLYLLCGSAVFKARKYQLWHIVFSKNGLIDGYKSRR